MPLGHSKKLSVGEPLLTLFNFFGIPPVKITVLSDILLFLFRFALFPLVCTFVCRSFLKHPDFLRSVQISGDKFRSSGLLSKIFGFRCLFRHLTLDAVSASLLDASSTFILDAALTSSSVRSAMTMQTTALACSACSLPSLHSPYHSVIFKFDFFGKRRFKSLASKKHRMESVCRSRKIGFRLFLCLSLPFCILPYRSRPRSLYLISINQSSAQTGYLFLQIAFGLGFGIGFACSVWTCSVVCTIIIAYFWDLSIPFLKIFLIFL